MRIVLALVVVAAPLMASCTTTVGRFTILSTKYNEISRVDLTQVEYHRDVEAADGRVWILFVPVGTAPTMERAVDECLRSGFGDFMTSCRVDSFWWSCFFVSYESYRVRGDVGNSIGVGARQVGPQAGPATPQSAGASYQGSGRR